MKQWFSQLSNYYKATIVSSIVIILVYLGLIFGYFINLSDIPNGLIAGGILGVLSYLFLAIAEQKEKLMLKSSLAIAITVIRFILIAILLIVSALLEYKFNLKIFNLFTILGGYMIPLIVYLIILLTGRKNV